jgi:Flp pilus assembly protein TadD
LTIAPAVAQARLLIGARRFQDAVAALAPYLAGAPDDDEALCLVAQARFELDQPELALDAANAALRVSPDKEWALRLASLALARLGRFGEARAAADEAVRVSPNLWLTHLQRAQVDITAKHITATSWAAAQRAVELAPDEAGAHTTYGRVALADRQVKVAEKAFREALRLDPQDAAAHNNLGVALLRQRRLGRATSLIIGAAGIDPMSATYIANVGVSIRTWFSYLGIAGLILAEVVGDAHSSSGPSRPSDGHPPVLSICAALDVLAWAVVWWQLARAAGPVFGRYLRTALLRDRVMRIMILAPTAGVLCFAIAAVVGFPAATGLLWASAGCCAVTVILGRFVGWLGRRKRARAGPR